LDERIIDALAAGVSVITGNARLARRLRGQFDALQESRGLAAWPSVPILPWTAWLSSLWEEYQFAASGPPVRLGRWQELALWDGIVRSAPGAGNLLQAGATATAAVQGPGSGTPTTLLAGLGLVGLVGAGAAYLALRRRATT
jgi:hypothetical protein